MGAQRGGPFDSLGYRLYYGALRWQRELAQQLARVQSTPAQFAVLGSVYWLTRNGDSPSQIEVGRQAGLDATMTSKMIKSLVAEGLIVRRDDPSDSRAFRVALSAKGRSRAAAAVEIVQETEAGFFAQVDEKRELVAEVLRKIAFPAPPNKDRSQPK